MAFWPMVGIGIWKEGSIIDIVGYHRGKAILPKSKKSICQIHSSLINWFESLNFREFENLIDNTLQMCIIIEFFEEAWSSNLNYLLRPKVLTFTEPNGDVHRFSLSWKYS